MTTRGMLCCSLMASLTVVLQSSPKVRQWEEKLQRADNPTERARIVARLGPLELAQARQEIHAGNVEAGIARIEKFRSWAQSAYDQLRARVAHPAKHPSGFKELEISLRETLRGLDELLVSAPLAQRDQLVVIRADLETLHARLLDDLFPRASGRPK